MISRAGEWVRQHIGIVKIRQIADRVSHRLSFVPGLYVVGALLLVQCTLWVDRTLDSEALPPILLTTVDSARSVFTAIAGGLITSITLLLSMMLVAVQLASSQFSPRTLRDWLGDSFLKHAVGISLGTTVYSLLALRSTRSFGEEGGEIVPHTTVIIGVVFGVVALIAVVRSVDHITHSLRIGSVARRIAGDTIAVIDNADELRPGQQPTQVPSHAPAPETDEQQMSGIPDVPADAVPIEARASGWVQQIGASTIFEGLPVDSVGTVVVPLGAFVSVGVPLMWVSPAPESDADCLERLHDAFAIGDSRTLQQDVGFGILQLTDIAVRALSPGVNDPSTANDVIVHLGDVLLALWQRPPAAASVSEDGRTLVRYEPRHEQHLRAAFDPIRRYGRADPAVLATLARTLHMLRSEATRRSLPGPTEPIDEFLADIVPAADVAGWAAHETRELERVAGDAATRHRRLGGL